MSDKISPEEKLLRLIRGQKKQAVGEVKPAIINKRTGHFIIQKYLPVLDSRRIISVALVISCLYLIISLIYPWFGLRKIILPKEMPQKFTPPELELANEVKPYEFYSEAIKSRKIFGNQAAQSIQGPIASVNADLIKDINLVGIISGENPQAVIEDKKSQKTYYVAKGQFIGEFQVEDIQEGKIILSYQGQKYELYL